MMMKWVMTAMNQRSAVIIPTLVYLVTDSTSVERADDFGQSFVSQERRAYTAEEVKQRRRTEPRLRSYGPRTVISIVKTDAKGRQLAAKKQALFARLSKIQGSLINSIERNYWEAKPKLKALPLN